MKPDRTMNPPSKLQTQLAGQILEYVHDRGLPPATHLSEPQLCRQLHVSRTPVRAALSLLSRQGYLEHVPHRGYFTVKTAADVARRPRAESDEDRLYLEIAEDRVAQRLPAQVSEADLTRRYPVPRGVLTRVLQRLLREGLVERRRGRGWTFAPVLDSQQAHDESYRFRLAIEPLALLEPGFRLDPELAARCVRKHESVVQREVQEITPIELFEMNAEFHEMLAAASGNRYFLQAIQQQNRLRRFVNYHWTYGTERVVQTCQEHLAVLHAALEGDLPWAATLLRRHLEISSTISPYAGQAERTVPERLIKLG